MKGAWTMVMILRYKADGTTEVDSDQKADTAQAWRELWDGKSVAWHRIMKPGALWPLAPRKWHMSEKEWDRYELDMAEMVRQSRAMKRPEDRYAP